MLNHDCQLMFTKRLAGRRTVGLQVKCAFEVKFLHGFTAMYML